MYQTGQLITSKTHEVLSIEETLRLREEFAMQYSTSKGWNRFDLTIEQIAEIRSHSQWKNPGLVNG